MMTAFLRTIILYILIITALRLLGKHQIGELEPNELVLTMMISDLAAVPMQDFGIPLLSGVIPILTLIAISMLFSQISLQNLRIRRILCGSSTPLIRNGKLDQSAMRKNHFTLDELLEELRKQGYTRIEDIKYAILETTGQLSVFPWPQLQPPTAQQLNYPVEDHVTLPVILINDGRILQKNLSAAGYDLNWLSTQLKKRGICSARNVFLLTLDEQGEISCIKKDA